MVVRLQVRIYYINVMGNNRVRMRCNGYNSHCNQEFLNETFWQKLGGAFTDPDKRFEFPVKPFETDLTQETKNSLYLTAGILAAGSIITALIIVNRK